MYGFADAARTTLIDEEAAVLQAAGRRRLEGQSWYEITAWMEAEGHLSTMGNPMRPGTLAEVFANPAAAGLKRTDSGELVKTGGPAAISPEMFVKVAELNESRRPATRRDDQDYLLTGDLSVTFDCGLCGTPLSTSPSNSGSRGYRCKPSTRQHPGGCGRVRLNADLGEKYVIEHVLAELSKPEVRAVVEAAKDSLLAEIPGLKKRLEEDKKVRRAMSAQYAKAKEVAHQDLAGGVLADVEEAKQELARRLQEAEAVVDERIARDSSRLRFLSQVSLVPSADVPSLIRWWKHAPLKSRKALIGAMLERISVYPGGRGSRTVDADRVALQWRKWDETAAQ
ncbi:recombinase zinc beta ribbon domain-containing protein [Kitasatospora sp. NPDC002522]